MVVAVGVALVVVVVVSVVQANQFLIRDQFSDGLFLASVSRKTLIK